MPFYSNAANFALLCYGVCCDTHCSRFKIPRRGFQTLRCLPLDTTALKFNQIGNCTRCDEQDERNEHNRRRIATYDEPKRCGAIHKRAKF